MKGRERGAIVWREALTRATRAARTGSAISPRARARAQAFDGKRKKKKKKTKENTQLPRR